MSEEMSADQPAHADDQPAPDFQTAFWATKHALAAATAAAFWRLGLATPTVTRAATRMEAAGLLRREPQPGDRRLVRLVLTERGRSLEDVIAAETDKLTERALATFGPAEREAVIRAL